MPEVAQATITVTPVLEGAQQKITDDLTGIASAAGDKAGSESGTAFSGSFTKTLIGGTAALTTAVVGAGAAMVGAAGKTAEYGDQIDKASQKLGVSSTFYQEWDAVLQHSGTSMDSMSGTFKKLANASQDASKDQEAAFKKLGLSMDQVKNMSTEELFASVVGGLQNMEEGSERTAIATELLGKGAMEMGALFNTSADDTQAMIDRVHELGGVIDEDGVKASAAYQDSLQDMKTAFSGVANGLMVDLLPPLTDFMTKIADFISTTDLSPVTDTIGKAVTALGDFISSLDIQAAGQAFGVVVEGIGAALELAWNVVSTVFDAMKSGFETVSDALEETGINWDDIWGGISDAVSGAAELIGAAIELIANIIAALIKEVQTDGTYFNTVWENMQTYVEMVADVISGVIETVTALLNGDWDGAWEAAKGTVESVTSGMSTILTNSWEFLKTTAQTVWNAIKAAIEQPIQNAKESVSNIIDEIKTKLSDTWEAIKDTVATTVESMQATITEKWEAIKAKVSEVVDGVKSTISDGFEAAKQTVQSVFDAVHGIIQEKMDAAKNIVSNAVEAIKGFFNFNWSLPDLVLPHIVVSDDPEDWWDVPILGHIPKPSAIGVEWYQKAYETPYLFTTPTIVGNRGFGDGGGSGELLYGRDQLLRDIAMAAGETVINVYASDGMDVVQLANKVSEVLALQTRQAQSAWSGT